MIYLLLKNPVDTFESAHVTAAFLTSGSLKIFHAVAKFIRSERNSDLWKLKALLSSPLNSEFMACQTTSEIPPPNDSHLYACVSQLTRRSSVRNRLTAYWRNFSGSVFNPSISKIPSASAPSDSRSKNSWICCRARRTLADSSSSSRHIRFREGDGGHPMMCSMYMWW